MPGQQYPYLIFEEDGRDPSSCLEESAAFQAKAQPDRVVTSEFTKKKNVGNFRLHDSRSAMCQWVESTPVPRRHFNVVIFRDDPVRLFLDLDMEAKDCTCDREVMLA